MAFQNKAIFVPVVSTFLISIVLTGCAQGPVASFRQPNRLYDISVDEDAIANYTTLKDMPENERARNRFISLRMYAIDMEYTKYESQLTHENQGFNLLATAASLGITGAGSVIPVGQATRVLSATATALTGATTAYDKEILLSQTIQNIQAQMRSSRMEQASKIIANMGCNMAKYPIGLALSDLEAYYRAGTMTAGLINMSLTLAKAEAEAKNKKDSVAPAEAVSKPAQEAIVAEAKAKAGQATATKEAPKRADVQQVNGKCTL